VRFKEVKICNFLSFRDQKIVLENGLYLLSGTDIDKNISNGSGKSSLVDSVCWALFGKTPRKVSSDSVINWSVSRECSVSLSVEEGDKKYLIVRGRKPNVLNFYIGTVKKTGLSINETQKFIESELGLTYGLFIHSVYFAQNSKIEFVTLDDNSKKDLLTELLDLSIFDIACNDVKTDIKELNDRLIDKKSKLDTYSELIDQKNKDISRYKELSDEFNKQKKDRINQLSDDRKDAVKENNEQKSIKNKEIGSLTKLVYVFKESLNQAECEKKALLDYLGNNVKELEEEKIKKIEKEINDLKIYSVTKLSENEFEANKIKEAIGTNKQQANSLLGEVKRMELLEDGSCRSCYQPISKGVLNNQTESYKLEIYESIKKFNKLKESCKYTERNRDLINQYVRDKKTTLESNLGAYLKDLKIFKEKKYKKEQDVRKLDQEINRIKSSIEYSNLKVKDNNEFIISAANRLTDRTSGIDIEIDSFKKSVNKFSSLTKESIDAVDDLSKKLKECEANIRKYEVDLQYLFFQKNAFSNKGVKSYVFEQIVNEINIKSNEFLGYLFDSDIEISFQVKDTKNSKGEDKNKFETSIYIDDQIKEFGSFSGGEKRRIILAVDLALSQIIQNRSSKSVSFLVFDEYFDGLDYFGKEKVMELLSEIKETTVLVIDHSSEFQNMFDHVIKIEKNNGISRIV